MIGRLWGRFQEATEWGTTGGLVFLAVLWAGVAVLVSMLGSLGFALSLAIAFYPTSGFALTVAAGVQGSLWLRPQEWPSFVHMVGWCAQSWVLAAALSSVLVLMRYGAGPFRSGMVPLGHLALFLLMVGPTAYLVWSAHKKVEGI